MTDIAVDGAELLEWLRARNKVGAEWVQKLKVLRLKQAEVVEDLRRSGIAELGGVLDRERRDKDASLSFADLLELQERVLKSKEAEGRTLFGSYSHPAVKNLVALMKLYQRDNLHVISLAHELSQVITFDLVAAKKAVKGYDAQISDLTTKIGLYEASIRNSRLEITRMTKRYASDFELDESQAENLDFPGLIGSYVQTFGAKAGAIVEAAKRLEMRKLVSFYQRFGGLNDARGAVEKDFSLLIWLSEKGDTLVSDFNNGTSSVVVSQATMYEDILAQKGYRKSQAEADQIGELTSGRRVADRGSDAK
jgi:hypothetical protein